MNELCNLCWCHAPARAAALLLTAALACSAPGASAAQNVLDLYNETVCYVNDDPISKREVEDRIDPLIMAKLMAFRQSLIEQGKWDEKTQAQWNDIYLPDFRRQLRLLVREKLMLQEAREHKIQIDKVELARRNEALIQQLKTQDKLGRKGFSLHEIRRGLEEQMLLEEFQSEIVTALDLPNRTQVEAHYRQHLSEYQRPAGVKLRMIRVDKVTTNALGHKAEVENPSRTAEALREEVVAYGRNFADLAREKSHDPEARARGGLVLGPDGDEYIDAEQSRLASAPEVRELKQPGDVSRVFELPDKSGWAFVLLEDRRAASPRPLDRTLYDKIYNQLLHEIIKQREDEWFRDALKRSLVLDGRPRPQPIPLRFFLPDDKTLAEEPRPKASEPQPRSGPKGSAKGAKAP
jgi:parvulin-like peptidyl-prolyl isomerase